MNHLIKKNLFVVLGIILVCISSGCKKHETENLIFEDNFNDGQNWTLEGTSLGIVLFQDNMLQITEADTYNPTTASLNLDFITANKFCIVINFNTFKMYRKGTDEYAKDISDNGNEILIYLRDFYIKRKYTRHKKTRETTDINGKDLHFYINKSTGNFKVKVNHTGKNVTDYFEKVEESSLEQRLVISNKKNRIWSNNYHWMDPLKVNRVKIYDFK